MNRINFFKRQKRRNLFCRPDIVSVAAYFLKKKTLFKSVECIFRILFPKECFLNLEFNERLIFIIVFAIACL